MDYLKLLIDKIVNSDEEELRRNIYKTDIMPEQEEVLQGKFSLMYSEDLQHSYGVSFVDDNILYVYHFQSAKYLLEAHYNPENHSWSISNKDSNASMSSIIMLASKIRKLLQ